MKRNALGIIFGNNLSYKKLLSSSGLVTLACRRKSALEKFALKNLKNNRFAAKWFPQNAPDKVTRNPEKYRIIKSNYNRLRDGHLNTMRAFLNENHKLLKTNN